MTDWVVVLHPTQCKIDNFGDVSPSQSLNLTQQNHAFTNQEKCTTTQKAKLGLVAFYDTRLETERSILKGKDK